jgi:hypothetical protein
MAVQRTTSNLGFAGWEVNLLDDQGLPAVPEDGTDIGILFIPFIANY